MATRSDLRTRLQRRLGLGVVSAVEQERLNEALNSGISRALSDGVPGLSHDTFTGSVNGDLTLIGGATITAGSASVHLGVSVGVNPITSNVYPHDILEAVESGTTTKFLIRDVIDNDEVDIGIPAATSIAGEVTSNIIRRAIILPTSGQIISVNRVSSTGKTSRLSREPLYAHRDPFDTGTARFYEQRYSHAQGKSFISLWPAPTSNTEQFTVVQTRFISRLTSDSDTLAFPEEALDAILERARLAYLTWVGTHAATKVALATEAIRDTADSLKNTSSSEQIIVKQ